MVVGQVIIRTINKIKMGPAIPVVIVIRKERRIRREKAPMVALTIIKMIHHPMLHQTRSQGTVMMQRKLALVPHNHH